MRKDILDKHKNLWDNIANKSPKEEILILNKNEIWDEIDFFETGEVEVKKITQKIESLKKNMNYEKSLDFGCGIGRLSFPLSKIFNHVIGLDISKNMIEIANENKIKKNIENVNFVANLNNKLNFFKTNSIDFIVSLITLQHCPKVLQKSYIEEFCRVVKPKGLLYFQIIYGSKLTFKGIVYSLLSNRSILYLKKYFSIRDNNVEMHTIKLKSVIDILAKNKLRFHAIEKNQKAGNNFLSCTIIAEKK